eukprot:scpid89894/ scgid22889/ 
MNVYQYNQLASRFQWSQTGEQAAGQANCRPSTFALHSGSQLVQKLATSSRYTTTRVCSRTQVRNVYIISSATAVAVPASYLNEIIGFRTRHAGFRARANNTNVRAAGFGYVAADNVNSAVRSGLSSRQIMVQDADSESVPGYPVTHIASGASDHLARGGRFGQDIVRLPSDSDYEDSCDESADESTPDQYSSTPDLSSDEDSGSVFSEPTSTPDDFASIIDSAAERYCRNSENFAASLGYSLGQQRSRSASESAARLEPESVQSRRKRMKSV